MSDRPGPNTEPTVGHGADAELARLRQGAEPTDPRPVGDLVRRLESEGRLRSVRLGPAGTAIVRAITSDSRRVPPGALFVAVEGAHADGHEFARDVVAAGATVVVVERLIPGLPATQLLVDRTQIALAAVACWWYGDPSHEIGVVGVTGTDGKTTTSRLAAAALDAAGFRPGLISTALVRVGDLEVLNAAHATTPEAPLLQASLRAMVTAGNRAAVVETTSHGLALERVGGIAYDAAIFTNLTHEHLEFHGSFDAYRSAKLSLFSRLRPGRTNPTKPAPATWPKVGIVNRDDPAADIFAAAARDAGARVLTFGTDERADVHLVSSDEGRAGFRAVVDAPSGRGTIELALRGRFNLLNALGVVALGEGLGLDPAAVRAGLAAARGVPGRMEQIDAGQPFQVVVDYAHTPASLGAVLGALGPGAAASGGGLIVVLGSAGERDVAKRPLLGRIAGERCRLVVVTDEDPRGEDRATILEAIAAGAEAVGRRRGVDLLCIPDRRTAIRSALDAARPGDVVLLAGKGHEQSIIQADHVDPWDERAEAVAALADLGFVAG